MFNAIFVMPAEEVFVIPANHLVVVLHSGELFYKIEPLFLSLLNTMAAPFIGYAKNCAHIADLPLFSRTLQLS
ncbi:MAG: hypothetical protein QMD07_00845 [Thermodesulfovibrionales bacterium]|nr:hypothetical protein [Thermodesulfovibrionales bacterium]